MELFKIKTNLDQCAVITIEDVEGSTLIYDENMKEYTYVIKIKK